jgi:hypothetical protein
LYSAVWALACRAFSKKIQKLQLILVPGAAAGATAASTVPTDCPHPGGDDYTLLALQKCEPSSKEERRLNSAQHGPTASPLSSSSSSRAPPLPLPRASHSPSLWGSGVRVQGFRVGVSTVPGCRGDPWVAADWRWPRVVGRAVRRRGAVGCRWQEISGGRWRRRGHGSEPPREARLDGGVQWWRHRRRR